MIGPEESSPGGAASSGERDDVEKPMLDKIRRALRETAADASVSRAQAAIEETVAAGREAHRDEISGLGERMSPSSGVQADMVGESLPETIERLDHTIRQLTGSVHQLNQILQLQRDATKAELASIAAKLDVSNLNQQVLGREIAGLRSFVEERLEQLLRGQERGRDVSAEAAVERPGVAGAG